MLGIRFCGCGYGWVSVRFLCLFWRETHTKGLRARFPTRPEKNMGRQGLRADQKKAVNKRGKSTGKCSRSEVKNRRLLSEELGSVDPEAGLANVSQRSWWLCGNFARIHARDSPQKSVINFSLLALGANPSSWLFVLCSTLSVVYVVSCVFVKQFEMPLAGDERNH